jgi:hypothetical protein
LGIDRSKMKLYDVEQGAQDGIADSGQKQMHNKPMDKFQAPPGMKKKEFSGFKV